MAEKKQGVTYRDAGVNIDSKSESLKNVKRMVSSTFTKHVLSGIGHFGTLFDLSGLGYEAPVLVASTDGVGTKLKVAVMAGRHDTVGVDLVNHCVNDIVVQGATPLFFLDYIGTGLFEEAVFHDVVKGLSSACKANGMALVGGETAEMPGFYGKGDYDLVGCIVGAVEKSRIVDGSRVKKGDLLIGLSSSGLHTNGYSLVRKVLFEMEGLGLDDKPKGFERPLKDELLEPHRSYLGAVRAVEGCCEIKGMAHITGGGLTDNVPRVLPDHTSALIRYDAWPVPPIFKLVITRGAIASHESLHVFNMGIGFVIIVEPGDGDKALEALRKARFEPYVIGEIVEGKKEVIYEGI
jgi:phosphoribosylformylglycinamidine cyclo-ligase